MTIGKASSSMVNDLVAAMRVLDLDNTEPVCTGYYNKTAEGVDKKGVDMMNAADYYLHRDRKPYKAKHFVHKTIYVGNQSLRAFPF